MQLHSHDKGICMMNQDNLGVDGDAFYNSLMELHEGLSEADSHALNARLVLMFANEIGDLDRLKSILESAKKFQAG